MIEFLKRAVRWPWFGPTGPIFPTHIDPRTGEMRMGEGPWRNWPAKASEAFEARNEELNERIIANAAREATIAQKNVRLASTARTRGKLKDEIARLKRNKKRTSHLQAELARLTRLEHEIEENRETTGRAV